MAAHDGILIKIEADSFLIIFRRVDKALRCAVAMQSASQAYNRDRAPEDRVLLCLGIGYGPTLRIGDYDVFGQEVNAASKLGEDLASPGEILITGAARDELGAIAGCTFEDTTIVVPGSERNFRARFTASIGDRWGALPGGGG